MTPAEKNVLRSLVAVAWADGKLVDGESGVIEGLLAGFDASDEEEAEILEYARTPRSLSRDIPVGELTEEDRELLLSNAALLTEVDGDQSDTEHAVLDELVRLLEFDAEEAAEIVAGARDGVLGLGTKSLSD
jgi:uncharacterized membrane protein YebE (DUF533 family)